LYESERFGEGFASHGAELVPSELDGEGGLLGTDYPASGDELQRNGGFKQRRPVYLNFHVDAEFDFMLAGHQQATAAQIDC